MRLILLFVFLGACAGAIAPKQGSIELQVPLTQLMAYDCQSDGHSIVVRETSYDGIPISDGEVVLDYVLPEGTVWKDIKFRTHMGSLFITVPLSHPTMYTIATISDTGGVVV